MKKNWIDLNEILLKIENRDNLPEDKFHIVETIDLGSMHKHKTKFSLAEYNQNGVAVRSSPLRLERGIRRQIENFICLRLK